MKRERSWMAGMVLLGTFAIGVLVIHLDEVRDTQLATLTQRVEALEQAQEAPVELFEDPGELPRGRKLGLVR